MKKLLVTALTLSTLATAACSYAWQYAFEVTVADDVELPEGAKIVMAESAEDDISTAYGEAHDVEADRRDYAGEGSTCCSPSETLYLFAYVDLNDDGEWNAGEPWGEDRDNPVVIEDDGYVSEILIENDDEEAP